MLVIFNNYDGAFVLVLSATLFMCWRWTGYFAQKGEAPKPGVPADDLSQAETMGYRDLQATCKKLGLHAKVRLPGVIIRILIDLICCAG
jgi:hypothetical protein